MEKIKTEDLNDMTFPPLLSFAFLWKREEWFWSSWFADQEETLKDERFRLKPCYNSDIDVPIHYFTIGSGEAKGIISVNE